jgi:hypothetical protein
MDYDPFGLVPFTELDNLSGILLSITSVLEIVKIVMEQKGFKGTGLNVAVLVAPNPVILLV